MPSRAEVNIKVVAMSAAEIGIVEEVVTVVEVAIVAVVETDVAAKIAVKEGNFRSKKDR